ncbi:hypothetical protein [Falsirhodobacter deserti]|nr:hypothetical protein [Falsirhodobacter deserti]
MVPALIFFGFGHGLPMTPLLNFILGFTTEQEAGKAGAKDLPVALRED